MSLFRVVATYPDSQTDTLIVECRSAFEALLTYQRSLQGRLAWAHMSRGRGARFVVSRS